MEWCPSCQKSVDTYNNTEITEEYDIVDGEFIKKQCLIETRHCNSCGAFIVSNKMPYFDIDLM